MTNFVETEGISVSELLGYMMYRMLYDSKKSFSNVGSDIYAGTFSEKHFDLHEAIAIMHTLTLSKSQMRQLKVFLESKGIHFLSTTELLEGRKALRPVIKPVLDGKGVTVDYETLVTDTVKAQLNVILSEKKELLLGNLKMVFKDGCDGPGQQVVWKSKSMVDAAENMFQYRLMALKVMFDEKLLWRNPVSNFPICQRPVYLIREKESGEEMITMVITATDAACQKLHKEGVKVNLNRAEVSVAIEIKDTMKDLKLKRAISGLDGADCILCKAK